MSSVHRSTQHLDEKSEWLERSCPVSGCGEGQETNGDCVLINLKPMFGGGFGVGWSGAGQTCFLFLPGGVSCQGKTTSVERLGEGWRWKTATFDLLGTGSWRQPPCSTHRHTDTQTRWGCLSLAQADYTAVPAPGLPLAETEGTYLCAGFHCPVQSLPNGLDVTPLPLNLGRAPGCCPFQGACLLPQGLHIGLSQALDFLSESIELLFQHLQGAGPGRSLWRWHPAALKATEGLCRICHS